MAEKAAYKTEQKRPHINKVSNSSLLATVDINGHTVKLMVDTGSSSTLLSSKVVRELFKGQQEVQSLDTSCNLFSVDGSPLEIAGKLELAFSIGDHMFQHEFLVADIDLPGILGLDFLEQYDITIKVASMSLQIGDKTLQLEREDSKTCARVKLSRRVVVPPNSEVAVKAYVKDQSVTEPDCLFEPYKILGTKGLLVSNSLVEPKHVVVSLINVTKKHIHVKQHTLVGSLTTVASVEEFQSVTDSESNKDVNHNQNTNVPQH